jgi:UDP-glucuronate 4-epimerase
MTILITGCAGFIGMHLARYWLKQGESVVGFDNFNDYYFPQLKEDRLKQLVIYPHFTLIRGDITDRNKLKDLFEYYRPNKVFHLAAQAGVRYSLTHPASYIQSNLVGFSEILECCRQYPVQHLIYASSSSVYGNEHPSPLKESLSVEHPISLYAATKIANEVMAYSYSHLYQIPCTGLRFFTVYGPWGRPDMSPWLFSKAILQDQPISVFNQGLMTRDFTYIDDIVQGTALVAQCPPTAFSPPHQILNIGNDHPVLLLDYIQHLERALNHQAILSFQPMQPGDVLRTHADITKLKTLTGFSPTTTLPHGLALWAQWFHTHHERYF